MDENPYEAPQTESTAHNGPQLSLYKRTGKFLLYSLSAIGVIEALLILAIGVYEYMRGNSPMGAFWLALFVMAVAKFLHWSASRVGRQPQRPLGWREWFEDALAQNLGLD